MAPVLRLPGRLPVLLAVAALCGPGCRLVQRGELDDCHRLSRTLRSENARLKDQMLALRSQNQDYSERAVDDARRLAQLEAANQRLETSVQAYQGERTRLESAYKELQASLPGALKPLSLETRDSDEAASTEEEEQSETAKPSGRAHHEVREARRALPEAKAQTRRKSGRGPVQSAWVPARGSTAEPGGSQPDDAPESDP